MIEGTKERIPDMANAGLKFVNKYHTSHFGFDLNRGGMKLKTALSNVIERICNEALKSFDTVHNSFKHLGDQVKDMYRKNSDTLMSISVQDIIDRLAHKARNALKHSQEKMHVFLDKITELLKETKFTVSGSKQKLSILEMLQLTSWSASIAIDRAIQKLDNVVDDISNYTRRIEFTIPGTKALINGNEIMDKLKSSTTSVYDQLRHSLHRGFEILHETFTKFIQVISEKARSLLLFLKDENDKIASRADEIYREVLQSSKQHTEEAKKQVVEFKDLTKLKIQEVYNAVSMEHVTSSAKETVSVLQSHLDRGLNKTVDLMRKTSQATAPYIRVSNKKMDIEVPLPFHWKSFSEWPMQPRL